jgi:hypothetical protein
MSTYEESVPIEEQADVVITLKRALNMVISNNEPCNQLVAYRTENPGTGDAKVVLVFDDAKCVEST